VSHVVPELDNPDVALVVADDALRAAMRMLLAVSGLRVIEYRTIAEFLTSAAGARRCLVVDCQLPEMPRRRLRDQIVRLDQQIPVVLVTAYSEDFEAAKAIRPHVYIVRKPFVGNHLVETVGDALTAAFGERLPGVNKSSP
jgi:FixJ family two-component response regulator